MEITGEQALIVFVLIGIVVKIISICEHIRNTKPKRKQNGNAN